MPVGIYQRTEYHKNRLRVPHKGSGVYQRTEEHKQKLKVSRKGSGIYIKTEEHRRKLSEKNKGKNKGKNNSNWKGGITKENFKIRNSLEIKLWRKSVLERDNFTCQKYGIKGGKLHSHHINNFADFSELRFAIDNGIALSDKAHWEFHHIYGRKNNTKEQLEEFLGNRVVVKN